MRLNFLILTNFHIYTIPKKIAKFTTLLLYFSVRSRKEKIRLQIFAKSSTHMKISNLMKMKKMVKNVKFGVDLFAAFMFAH